MGAKVLKVAVTQGKQILEQKLITERISVSVGSNASNLLVVKGEGVPKSFTLFEVVNGKYCLNFTEDMTGKVNVGGGQLDFETARRQTGVRKADNSYQMALSESAKGAVNLGKDGVRLIFQFVDAPAAVEPTKMPESTYMPPLQRLDRLFWTLLIISAVLHTVGVIAALNAPPPPKVPITQLPDRFAKLIIKKKPVVKPVKEKPKKAVKDGEGKPKPKADSEKKPKADKKKAATASASKRTRRK